MGDLIANFDWSATTLGPIANWPLSLKSAVAFLVRSRVPLVMLWGVDGVMIYNDGYSVFAGARHPDLLGQKVLSGGWPEVAEFNANVLKVGLAGGSLAYKDQELTLYRSGHPEQVFMDLDYSPVFDDDSRPAGVLAIVIETTERVTAEAIAREARERIQLALDAGAIVGMWVWNVPEDRFTADERFAASFDLDVELCRTGLPLEQVAESIHPDDQARVTAAIAEVLERGGRYRCEYRVRQRGQTYGWIEASGHVELDPDGKALRFPGVLLDISVRKGADDARLTSEARLRELNASLEQEVLKRSHVGGKTWQLSPEILGVANAAGIFESSNPAWAKILGWSQEELSHIPFLDLVHPDDLAKTAEGFHALQRGEPALRFENRYRSKAGGYRWLSWVAVPDGGKFYCSARDITDEVAAATERDRIFEISRDLFGVATFDGKLRSINPAWSATLGRSESDILSRPFSEIIHPDDLETTAEVVARLQGGQPVHQFRVRLLKADGEPVAFAWSAVPDAALDSGIFYTIGRDITEETAAAAELHQLQDALRQSQKMEAVGQLTGGIAHDFNNLLTGIAGSLELIQKRITDQALAGFDRHLSIAQASTQRAAALTQRLLAFSRRQTLDPKPVDANRLVRGVEDLIRRTVGPAVDVDVVGAVGLWATKVDGPQLENALLNLAINARDAMPDGGRIIIETANKWLDARAAKERDLEPGQYISLCVTDTGTGMTPEVIQRAFDPFYTTKPLGQGTGLGLSMIHGFTRQSGGQVRIYSELGQGTTMCLYFPRFVGDAEAEESADSDQTLEPGHGETVLVIDDEEPIRMLISDVLEEAGYRVLEAPDGPTGLKVLQSDARIDLLITDVGLPGGFNGRQVADAARQTRPGLKVLFVTGYAENAVVGNGHLDPGMQVITKPFPITAFALRVREIIEG